MPARGSAMASAGLCCEQPNVLCSAGPGCFLTRQQAAFLFIHLHALLCYSDVLIASFKPSQNSVSRVAVFYSCGVGIFLGAAVDFICCIRACTRLVSWGCLRGGGSGNSLM